MCFFILNFDWFMWFVKCGWGDFFSVCFDLIFVYRLWKLFNIWSFIICVVDFFIVWGIGISVVIVVFKIGVVILIWIGMIF